MASYHTKFAYNEQQKKKMTEMNPPRIIPDLLVTSFEPDDGFKETFLSMDPIYEDNYNGERRFDYGARYNTTAKIQISVIKSNGRDFSVDEVRNCLMWLTGSRSNSWLEILIGENVLYAFLGRVTNVQQRKMDARTIGLLIEFTSVSPWAYSDIQNFKCTIQQALDIDEYGLLTKDPLELSVGDDGILYNSMYPDGSAFVIDEYGAISVNDSSALALIDNYSDDLYSYINLNIRYENNGANSVYIRNETLDEVSHIKGLTLNEVVSISDKQFITSDRQGNRIFGDDFNFVWPRLAPGTNRFVVDGDGNGAVIFSWRYPMKVGDCAMDVSVYGNEIGCGGCAEAPSYDTVKWENIVNTPNTLGGYGITDAYTESEVDSKIKNINIDENELQQMLDGVLTQ